MAALRTRNYQVMSNDYLFCSSLPFVTPPRWMLNLRKFSRNLLLILVQRLEILSTKFGSHKKLRYYNVESRFKRIPFLLSLEKASRRHRSTANRSPCVRRGYAFTRSYGYGRSFLRAAYRWHRHQRLRQSSALRRIRQRYIQIHPRTRGI